MKLKPGVTLSPLRRSLERHNMYFSTNVIKMVTLKQMGRAEHVAGIRRGMNIGYGGKTTRKELSRKKWK
jgi:hypothetical protein